MHTAGRKVTEQEGPAGAPSGAAGWVLGEPSLGVMLAG